ncbi:MAG: hypothetical protein ACO3N7_08950 [Kiritimatiellia bacterium]
MILSLITVQPPRFSAAFHTFTEMCEHRYAGYLHQPYRGFSNGAWYTAIKPYHSGIFPFLALDLMVMFRGSKCNLFFGHDLLPYSMDERDPVFLDETTQHQITSIVNELPKRSSGLYFRGYSSRIDIGLNALSTLYMEILGSLTEVECGVLRNIRELQFERYQDPIETKTFGLQKLVAERLGKSPVAVHKSLRSSKYHLLADTANAMKNMMI